MNPKHDCHGLIDLIVALVTQDKILQKFLLFMEIIFQKPDDFLAGVVLGEVIKPNDQLNFPACQL